MAEILRYVDTGADASGDGTTAATSSGDNTHAYQSLSAWEAAEQTDLDTANDNMVVHCNRTNGGGIDQTYCGILGWTTSAADDIEIIADDFPATGIWDSAAYILENTGGSSNALEIREDYVRVVNLQALLTTTSGTHHCITVFDQTNGSNAINFDSCLVKGVCSGAGASYGINIASGQYTVLNVYNTIVTGFISGASNNFRSNYIRSGTANYYNCTIYNNYYGIIRSSGIVTVINCAIFNNTDDFNGTITGGATYCASDDSQAGTGNFQITQSADDYAALVTDAAGDDFSVTDASSELYQTGNGATPKSFFTDDIIGTERAAVDLDWDIGAFELVAGGDVTVLPTALAITAAVVAPTIVGDVTVSPSALAITAAVNAPTVTGTAVVSPSALGITAALNAPVIDITGSVTFIATALALTATLKAPTITTGALALGVRGEARNDIYDGAIL